MSIITVYADKKLVYNSRYDDYALNKLVVTSVLNKGGTCEIVMPPNHLAYDYFVGYKTIVTVYKDSTLIFRGRSLFPEDDFELNRTVICEGELCFLNDHVVKPFEVSGTLNEIFTWLFNGKSGDSAFSEPYNSVMNVEKRFTVGYADPYISSNVNAKFEIKTEYTTLLDLMSKLLERFGGRIYITGDENHRTIYWKQVPFNYVLPAGKFSQAIELGNNVLNINRDYNSSDFATRVYAHGKAGDVDYYRTLSNSQLESVYGVVSKFVDFGEVIDSSDLDVKLAAELDRRSGTVISLSITALDLSNFDEIFDTFPLGESNEIRAPQYGINGTFQLVERVEDLIDASNNVMTFGKIANKISQTSFDFEQLDPDRLKKEITESLTEAHAEKVNNPTNKTKIINSGYTRIGNVGIEWGTYWTTAGGGTASATIQNHFKYIDGTSAVVATKYDYDNSYHATDSSAITLTVRPYVQTMTFRMKAYDATNFGNGADYRFCWLRIGQINDS